MNVPMCPPVFSPLPSPPRYIRVKLICSGSGSGSGPSCMQRSGCFVSQPDDSAVFAFGDGVVFSCTISQGRRGPPFGWSLISRGARGVRVGVRAGAGVLVGQVQAQELVSCRTYIKHSILKRCDPGSVASRTACDRVSENLHRPRSVHLNYLGTWATGALAHTFLADQQSPTPCCLQVCLVRCLEASVQYSSNVPGQAWKRACTVGLVLPVSSGSGFDCPPPQQCHPMLWRSR